MDLWKELELLEFLDEVIDFWSNPERWETMDPEEKYSDRTKLMQACYLDAYGSVYKTIFEETEP